MTDDENRVSDDTQRVLSCDGEKPVDALKASETLEQNHYKSRRLFFGSYIHGIDAKGRLIIPNAFREKLGSMFTVGPTTDFQAIAIYPLAEWERQLDKLDRMRQKDIRAQKYIDRFSKFCYDESETDAQGRLLLPQRLRGFFLGEAREVEVSGAMSHIRIVDIAKVDPEDNAIKDEAPGMLELLSTIVID